MAWFATVEAIAWVRSRTSRRVRLRTGVAALLIDARRPITLPLILALLVAQVLILAGSSRSLALDLYACRQRDDTV